MDFQAWTAQALENVQKDIAVGQIFELKTLFAGYDWEALDVNDRRQFGRYFANEVREKRITLVQLCKSERRGNTKYRKCEREDFDL